MKMLGEVCYRGAHMIFGHRKENYTKYVTLVRNAYRCDPMSLKFRCLCKGTFGRICLLALNVILIRESTTAGKECSKCGSRASKTRHPWMPNKISTKTEYTIYVIFGSHITFAHNIGDNRLSRKIACKAKKNNGSSKPYELGSGNSSKLRVKWLLLVNWFYKILCCGQSHLFHNMYRSRNSAKSEVKWVLRKYHVRIK